MRSFRNGLSNVLVAVVVVVIGLWFLRSVFRVVSWGVNLIVIVAVLGAVLWAAAKLRN